MIEIIKTSIRFLGIVVGYKREIKLETYAEGIERIKKELEEFGTQQDQEYQEGWNLIFGE